MSRKLVKINPNYPNGKRTYLNALLFAIDGLKYAYRNEAAIRLEILLLIVSVPIACFISATWVEFIILIMSMFLLLIIELVNTAIEATIDRISLEHHDLSKIAKDVASCAVFISSLLVVLVWLSKIIIFILNRL